MIRFYDATTEVKATLVATGTPIGPNDSAIAGRVIAASALLVMNNVKEFEQIEFDVTATELSAFVFKPSQV